MTIQEKDFTPQESVELIRKMMTEVRGKFIDDGFHFMLWGLLVIGASLTNYFLLQSSFAEKAYWPWMIMPLVGVPVAIWYGIKQSKKEQVQSHARNQYGMLWLAFGITLFTVIFFSVKAQISPIPFILSLVGMATFISGIITRFRPLVLGGVVFWVSAIVSLWLLPADQLLLNAAATFCGYIIPAILMRKQIRVRTDV